MIEVIGVTLEGTKKQQYFKANGNKIKENIQVIVETENGLDIGTVTKTNFEIKNQEELTKIVRIAKKEDQKRNQKNNKDAKEALKTCRKLIEKEQLEMFLIDAHYTFDRDKLIFKFLANGRVDFRQLAKDLAQKYKVRIELRQIGVRDKAKEVGGYGPCGQTLCCARFLKDLNKVSINMAKNQDLALNPTKINGSCGRLMCCLQYEDDNYTENAKNLPKIGSTIKTEEGTGKVISIDKLNQTYQVEIKNKGIITQNGKTNN